MDLRIIATGGTFDKVYDPIVGSLGFADTHLRAIVARARIVDPVEVEVAMLLDSLDMDASHRVRVLAACRASPQQRIVIVHGTDTMVETARTLGEAGLAKTIVLTGAMVPYDVEGSDALFNLGFAIGCARTMAAGVYVAMNARAHAWDKVRKNREAGLFEALP